MDETYSIWTGLVYVFNLIVGTGALTLPVSFSQSGWLIGAILITLLALISYITATFVVEAIATSNAIKQWKQPYIQAADSEDEDAHTSEDTPLCRPEHLQNFPTTPVSYFTLDEKLEMGEMANLLFSKVGQLLFYLCLCSYLFGDLAIYSAAVSDSLVDVICTNCENVSTNCSDIPCWSNSSMTEKQAYRLFLCAFLVVFGPFAYFNVQKTKYLQMLTSVTRWLAFIVMIGLAIRRLLSPNEKHGSPATAQLSGIPVLFGSCIYSFMCHHSLPGLISPITNKSNLNKALAADYFLVLSFYLTLALTSVFAFPELHELYTLNFTPKPNDPFILRGIDYFLTLFPVFTLSTNFPVVAVTLRSNLQSIISPQRSWFVRRILVPTFAVTAPVLLAMVVPDVESLVKFTGSYAGTGIQYVIPAFLVIKARSSIPEEMRHMPNKYVSPFSSNYWPVLIIIWSVICSIFVTYNIASSFLFNYSE
ncbi:transmembrane protein 104 homolog isoform X2 [Lycorma delicatula]|uniref:transmembrane protein 104 homolog isoform X2 n=1 Tax=Lycorma delicatula TaxID=130591 RepID=UPI003F511676